MTSSLGPLEKDVMTLVWAGQAHTVRDAWQKLSCDRTIAYTTVMTIMSRLHTKGLLKREKQGKTYYYSPNRTKDQTLRTVIHQVISTLIDRFGDEAVAAFIDEADRLSTTTTKKKK